MRWLSLLSVLMIWCPPMAEATFSIVGTDKITRQVGGAGASCLQGFDLYDRMYFSSPNRSVLHAQGWLLTPDGPIAELAQELLDGGESSPAAVLEAMNELDTASLAVFEDGRITTENDGVVDDAIRIAELDLRQYATADFSSVAAYSGSRMKELVEYMGYADFEVGEFENVGFGGRAGGRKADRYNSLAIGNSVANGTVKALHEGFAVGATDCDLAGRFLSAMSNVLFNKLGDIRCLQDEGRSATSAYIHVDNPDGTPYLHINVIDFDGNDPVSELINPYFEWRKENPCDFGDDAESSLASSADVAGSAAWNALRFVTILVGTAFIV